MPTIVSSGMHISGAVIAGGGATDALYCYKHGVVSSATVSSGGTMYISGGAARNVEVLAGTVNMLSGYAEHIRTSSPTVGAAPKAQFNMSNGVIHDFTMLSNPYSSTDFNIYPAGVVNNVEIGSRNRLFVTGGTINNCIVRPSHAYLCTAGKSIVNDVTAIGSNTWIYNRNSSVINNVTVTSKAFIVMQEQSVGNNVTLNSGCSATMSGGICNNWVVSSGACVYLTFSGGHAATMNNAIVLGGGTIWVSSGCTVSNTSCISAGQIFISSGGVYRGGLLSERVNNNMQLGLQGGTVDGCTVTSGAWLRWWHGVVRNITITSNALASDDNNQNQVTDIQNVTIVSGGSATITQSRTIEHVTARNAGKVFIGHTARGRDINVISGGQAIIYSSATVSDIHASGSGALVIARTGATVNNIDLLSSAQLQISGGCTVNNVYAHMGTASAITALATFGEVTVNNVICHSGAQMSVNSGAVLSGGHVQYPTNTCIYSRDGGLVVDCWAHQNGYVWISPGGSGSGGGAYSMTSSVRGGSYVVYGSAYDLMCSSAFIYARNSGTTIGIISGVDVYPGGILYCNGGTTYNAVLHSGGSASTSSGSCLNIIRYGGAKVTSNVDTDIITYGPEPSLIGHGLVYWLDALNNTGKGYMDKEATTWVDVCNTGNNIPINLAYAMWDGNRCLQTVDGFTTARSTKSIFTADGPWTIEGIAEVPAVEYAWAIEMRTGATSPTPEQLGVQIVYKRTVDSIYIGYYAGSGTAFAYADALNNSKLAILTCTIDANKLVTLYVNGVATTSATTTAVTIRPVNRLLRLFAFSDNAVYSHAGTAIYAVHIYNRALTAAEVAANYAYGCSRYNLNLN